MVAWAVWDYNRELVSLLLTQPFGIYHFFLFFDLISILFWHVNKGACACACACVPQKNALLFSVNIMLSVWDVRKSTHISGEYLTTVDIISKRFDVSIARVVGVWATIHCLCSSPTVGLEQERELSAVGRLTDSFDINVVRRLFRICSRPSTQHLIWILHTGMETVLLKI